MRAISRRCRPGRDSGLHATALLSTGLDANRRRVAQALGALLVRLARPHAAIRLAGLLGAARPRIGALQDLIARASTAHEGIIATPAARRLGQLAGRASAVTASECGIAAVHAGSARGGGALAAASNGTAQVAVDAVGRTGARDARPGGIVDARPPRRRASQRAVEAHTAVRGAALGADFLELRPERSLGSASTCNGQQADQTDDPQSARRQHHPHGVPPVHVRLESATPSRVAPQTL
jgi:hypothetical protein